jgi:hypothetical protein
VVNAQSNYLRAYQDAKLLREQARQAKVDTRRRVFDQWLYEREKTPSPEQMRQEFMKEQVKRSLNNPPRGEVNSGKSLNDLLAALETMPVKGASVPDLPLSEDILRHINVTRDGTGGGGNLGVLRNSGKLAWPRALADLPGTEDLRSNLAKRAEVAYEQAVSGRADPTVLEKMAAASRELNDRLTAVVRETDFGDYSEAKRFLRNLDDAIQSLRNPEAGRLLTGADGASGKSVKDLVSNMLGGGYRFAPAVSGGESAYQALHSKLVNFYNSLQTASNTPTP